MTTVAMSLDELDVWLQGRTGAAATNLSMLDGFVTAVVAGPVSMDPPEWICPLLGIGIDAFNHGGTPEFAAISAVWSVTMRSSRRSLTHPRPSNRSLRVSRTTTRCGSMVRGLLRRNEGETIGVGAAQESRRHQSRSVVPILFHCVDDQGRPMLGPSRKGPETEQFSRIAYKDISAVVEEMRQYWMPTRFKTRS